MAIIGYEHFETYGTSTPALQARGYSIVGGIGLTNTRARTGTTSITLNHGSGERQIRFFPGTPRTTAGQGTAMYISGTPTNTLPHAGLRFSTVGGTDILRVNPNTSLGFSVFLSGSEVGTSDPGIVNVNSWFWIEARAITGPGTTGRVTVRLNGAEIIDVQGLNLINPWTSIALGSNNTASNSQTWFDDWIIWDDSDTINNDFIGDTFIFVAPPTADGTPSDWVPSSGVDRWALIDESTPSDTDFLIANNVGDANEFTHQALNLPVGSVTAIATQARSYKLDSGSSSVAVGLASGNSTSMSNERALATGAAVVDHIANRNPDGNVPWTQNSANSARMRFERLA